MADTGLVNFYTTKYTEKLGMKLQQQGSMLRGLVDVQTGLVGKLVSPVQQVGAVQTRTPQGRFSPKVNTAQDYTRRWMSPTDKVLDQYEDSFDKLRAAIDDPKSIFTQGAAYAAGRDWDDAILAAATSSTAQIGVDVGNLTSESFDTSKFQIASTFGASAATGLTVAKMIEANRILRKYHNDFDSDPKSIIIGSTQEADLLKQVQVTSADYNAEVAKNSVLVDGKVTKFMGFSVVVMERVPETTAGSVRGVIAFVKSGLTLGIWQDLKTQIFQRPDLEGNPWDVSTVHTFGATRTQPGKIIQILCADTAGTDITP